MKNLIRNIGIFAHIDSGKTTFTERILYESGELDAPGSVEDGTTEMDTLPEEIERGISITASTTQFKYKLKKTIYLLNIIDTPGHLDFHSQVDTSLLAVDIAVLLIDITTGIRSQTEIIAKKIIENNLPMIIFINKIDKYNNIDIILKELDDLFEGKKVPVFKFTNNSLIYVTNEEKIDENLELSFIEWNSEYIDKYFSTSNPKKILLNGLKEGFKQRKLFPIFVGSGLVGIGIKECIQLICSTEFDSKPRDYDAIVFKRQIHPILGRIIYLKIFSPLKEGELLFKNEVPFEISHIYTIVPGGIHETKEAPTNSIISFSVPKDSDSELWSIGDILRKNPGGPIDNSNEKKIQFAKEFVQILEPESEEFRPLLIEGIRNTVWEDPGLDFYKSDDTGQYHLYGMGELHLEVSIHRIQSFVGDSFSKKNIYVSRYGLINVNKENYLWEHSTSDGKFFSYGLQVELSKNDGFVNTITLPTRTQKNIQNVIESAFYEFVPHGANGNPILGLKLDILRIFEPRIENEHSLSLTKVALIAGLKLSTIDRWVNIGPVSFFEITLPHSQVGIIISVLQKRGAKISGMTTFENNKTIIKGKSLSESLLGFTASLRNLTQGKASISLITEFDSENYFEVGYHGKI